MIQRTLTKAGKQVTLTATDLLSAQELCERSRTKMRHGWAPVGGGRQSTFTRALEAFGIQPRQFVGVLSAEELDAFYAQATRQRRVLELHVLRQRPTPALLEHLLMVVPLNVDFSRTIQLITKDETVATWVQAIFERLSKSSGTKPELAQFAKRQLKNRARRARDSARRSKLAPSYDGEGDDERALLEQIHAHPNDDAPRRVYADFLTERGLGWGEAMLAEFDLPPEGHPDYAAEWEQVVWLQQKRRTQWLNPIRPFITRVDFKRGLLGSVHAKAEKFLEAAEAIALRAPRGSLILGRLKPKHVAALAQTPLGRFAKVDLSHSRINDAQLQTLMASPTIAGVEVWSLDNNHFGDDGVGALANSPYLASVTKLFMENNTRAPTIGPVGLGRLLRSTALPSLRVLSIDVTHSGDALEVAPTRLTTLGLGLSSDVDDRVLDSLSRWKGLRHLSVQPTSRPPSPDEIAQRLGLPLADLDDQQLEKLERLRRLLPPARTGPASYHDEHVRGLVEALPNLTRLELPRPLPPGVSELLSARATLSER